MARLCAVLRFRQFLPRDIDRIFDNFKRFAVQIEDRVIGGLNPNLARLRHQLAFRRLEIPPSFRSRQNRRIRARRVGRLDKHAVMLAHDVFQS